MFTLLFLFSQNYDKGSRLFMNISDILGDSLKKQLKDSLTASADPPQEIDPLEKRTKKSLKENTVLFRGSKRKALPRRLLQVIGPLYANYKEAIASLAEEDGFAVPIDFNYQLVQGKQPNIYIGRMADGSIRYYDKHNATLRLNLYHDYKKEQDYFRLALNYSNNRRQLEPYANNAPQTFTIPANDELRRFYQQWKTYKAQRTARSKKLDYLEPIYDSFVAFDLERTGRLKGEPPEADKIIEIGAVRVVKGKITDTFDQLVDPQKEMLYRVIKITGIKPGMLRGKPTADKAVRDFLDFVGNDILIGHSLDDNDLPPIRREAKNLNLHFCNKHYDTFRLSLLLQEKHGLEHTNLEYLAEKLSITPQSFHRANDDAATTAMVYLKLRELYYAKDPAEK